MKNVLWLVVLVLGLTGSLHAQEPMSVIREIISVTPLEPTVGLYEKFEAVIELDADFTNPYDPADIRLDGRFTSPSGRAVTVPGFYYREFELEVVGESEILQRTNEWSWRVRFTPTEVGEWRYQIIVTTQSGAKRSPNQTFEVTPSDKRGFVRVDARNPRYLAFDDGSPYFPVGENMAWYGNNGMADYQAWLDSLAAAGGNFIRVWFASWGFNFEWNDTGLGNYDARQDRAFRLDKLFEMVEARDIYIMLCLLNHGPFSLTTNSEWDANPYNVANGGPLSNPQEFATNPEAIRLWNQKLRYTAARWGYSPNIMAWEWWNEVNWTPLASPDVLAPWVSRSTAALKVYDPYDHLITHSGSTADHSEVWESLSFTQDHLYDLRNLPREFNMTVLDWLDTYPDKPFLMGEFGSPQDFDTIGLTLHLGLWSPPMNGAMGTGMMWWWDTYVHPNNMYGEIEGVARFYAGEDLAAHLWQPTSALLSEDANAYLYGIQAEETALLWVVSKDFLPSYLERQYTRNLRDGAEDPLDITFPDVTEVTLTVPNLTGRTYTVEIWNTHSGNILSTIDISTDNGSLTIALPPFNHDLALKIK